MKTWLRKKLPQSWLLFYHRAVAWLAAVYFWFPSRRLIVIGVTGTKGKTTVCNLLSVLLEEAGHKVGMATTANFKIDQREWINDKKQTMLGRFQLQGMLWEMIGAGCKYAIIETSSEGIAQYRHSGINYDVAVFTNLTPEHIESHGSFQKYKEAKGQLFAHLTTRRPKKITGKPVPKIIVANTDDEQADYFLSFAADQKVTFGVAGEADIKASDVTVGRSGLQFKVDGVDFTSPLLGKFNVYNILGSVAVGKALGLDVTKMPAAIAKVKNIPGRMETISASQDFTVIVDYAHEPHSFEKVLRTVGSLYDGKLIVVTGSCGGGRDKKRQPVMGQLAARYADQVIVTNEDPYDDDPQEIIDEVAAGAEKAGKVAGNNLFKILDRRAGIKKALSLARTDDVVLIVGKGSEPVMAVAGGKHVSSDDREMARELLNEIVKDKS
ncbi:MAG: UDP-N-acetylmuramoyl-L-alanyl-D-glutamate--2,6-diaminopimelate ligase [Parcubacteria group bacterium]|nr:UDP-N-acetylmuramoyl-L-alanyl-D-glutamate--2,6-diaminopimelate ligase [Parcubacteria group bacterium]